MTTTATREYVDIVDVAKIVRGELGRHFSGTKFSVRISRYSGGSGCRVSWTDGPSPRQVDAVIGRFGGKTFDGSDDSTHYHDTEWQGQMVCFAGYGPSTSRRITNEGEWVRRAEAMIRERCVLEDDGRRFGGEWLDRLTWRMVWNCDFREAAPLDRAFRLVVLREEPSGG